MKEKGANTENELTQNILLYIPRPRYIFENTDILLKKMYYFVCSAPAQAAHTVEWYVFFYYEISLIIKIYMCFCILQIFILSEKNCICVYCPWGCGNVFM